MLSGQSSNYANCIGYAFEQCYSSCISILTNGKDYTEEKQLDELKVLVVDYKKACEIVEDSTAIINTISKDLQNKIVNAVHLEDCYK